MEGGLPQIRSHIILSMYNYYWLQGTALKLYMKTFASHAVCKYLNKKILSATSSQDTEQFILACV